MAVVQEEEGTSNVKPKSLKEAIILVLQEAGPGGLTLKEIVQRIKKKKWWDLENGRAGYVSVKGICGSPRYRDIFVHVAPGTYALWTLQDDDFTPYVKPVKPMEVKKAIILVLQEAGPGGLTVRQIVQRMEEKFSWDWKNDEAGYHSVSATCCEPRHRDIFVRVAAGTFSLWSLQDDDFTPYVKPMELKEAIILVLQEAGPGGLTVKQMVQRIKKKRWWDWKNKNSGPQSVSNTCRKHSDIFVMHSPGVYALKSLQRGEGEEAEGSAKALIFFFRNAERTASGAKRVREGADGSADELNQITAKKKKKKKKQVLEEPKNDTVPVEDRRLVLYSPEYMDQSAMFLQQALDLLQ